MSKNLLDIAKYGLDESLIDLIRVTKPQKMKEMLLRHDNIFQGRLPIHWAAIKGHPITIRRLAMLAKHFTGNSQIDAPSKMYGITPLNYAANNYQAEAVKMLLDIGANPAIKDKSGRNLLDHVFIRPDNFDVFMVVLGYLDSTKEADQSIKAKIAAMMRDEVGFKNEYIEALKQVFIHAAQLDRPDVLQLAAKIMATMGVDWKQDVTFKTGIPYAIRVAAENGSLSCLKYLVQDDVSLLKPHAKSSAKEFGTTLMHEIADSMPNLADLAERAKEGQTIERQYASYAENPGAQIESVQRAAVSHSMSTSPTVKFSDSKGCLSLLEGSSRSKVDKKLFEYVAYGELLLKVDADGAFVDLDKKLGALQDTLKYLTELGLDINAKNRLSRTPLLTLIQRKCPAELLGLFLQAGAKPTGVDLHLAITSSTPTIVKMLLSAGAPTSWKNRYGQNAGDVLLHTHNEQMLSATPELMNLMNFDPVKDLTPVAPKKDFNSMRPEERMGLVFEELKIKCDERFGRSIQKAEKQAAALSQSHEGVVMSNAPETVSPTILTSYTGQISGMDDILRHIDQLRDSPVGLIKPSRIAAINSHS